MMDLSPLKQFVPSHVCLTCEGCCRFKAVDSPWRPKMGEHERQSLALQVTALDTQGYIKTIQDCGNHLCQFFTSSTGHCQVYSQRPFECSLYPFILSQTAIGVDVHMHLSCPYIQDHMGNPALEEYVQYLKEFFSLPETRDFLQRNKTLLHDYSPFALELQFLFTIQGLQL